MTQTRKEEGIIPKYVYCFSFRANPLRPVSCLFSEQTTVLKFKYIEAWWFFRTNRNSPEFNRNSCRNIRWYFLPKFRITEIQNYRNSRNSRVPVCAKKFTVVEHHVNTLVIGNLCYLLHFHINHFNQTHGVDKPSLGSHNVTASTKTQNTAKSPLLYYQRGTFSISYT